MAYHGILELVKAEAQDVSKLSRNALAETADIDNGMLVSLGGLMTVDGYSEVFTATLPTDETATGLYIADEPINPMAYDTNNGEYSVGITDPGLFYNKKGKVFAVRLLRKGDIVKVSTEVTSGAADNFVGTDATGKFVFSATEPASGFAGKILRNDYFSVGRLTETLSQRADAYIVEVINN